jgi:triphosphoribosyl-dephospho-CoA synthase
LSLSAATLRAALLTIWGEALKRRASAAKTKAPITHGQHVAQSFGLRSACEEAALGFPCLFEVTWPALQQALAAGVGDRAARVQALFATLAVLDDTNVVYRGGLESLHFVQTSARQFLASGGVFQPNWVARARAVHDALVQRQLSPGGAADVLACACWLEVLDVKA